MLTGKESWEGSVLIGQVRDAEAETRYVVWDGEGTNSIKCMPLI